MDRTRKHQRELRRTSVKRRVHAAMSCRIHEFIHKKRISWTVKLGYAADELILHLEKQFTKGMTWENYGRGQSKWHIDHIVPASSFIFSCMDDPEFKACWSLANLRPCWGAENIRKYNKRLFLI